MIFLVFMAHTFVFSFSGLPSRPSASATATRASSATNVAETFSTNVMNTYGLHTNVDALVVSHAKGCKIYDVDGKEYMDMAAGIATCCLGHAHPALVDAIHKQMQTIHHCSNLYVPLSSAS